MKPNLRWKATIILTVVLLCLVGLTCFRRGTDGKAHFSFPTSVADLRENVSRRLSLGLDLRGGMHLILQVQVDEAVNIETDQLAERLPGQLREQGINVESARKTDATHVQVLGIPPEQLDRARSHLQDQYSGAYTLGSLGGEQSGLVLEMTPSYASQLRQETLRTSIEIIRTRIDELGVTEPTIAEHGRGEWEILVQLPGVEDEERVKGRLQSTAMLEIKLVKEGPFATESEALGKTGGLLPPDSMLLRESAGARRNREGEPAWYIVSRTSAVTGRDLRTARAEINPESTGTYQISFSLSREGAARFGPFTEQNIGQLLAVVLDNRIQSVATIQSRIEDSGRITGQFSLEEARDLAVDLRSGALPASIRFLEERTVGASLGADSIRAGFIASVVGLAAVVLFMLFYYRLAGVNAVVALVLNLIILLAVLAYFGATLTLPGIAGIALTIGMAVDANVLVFERIREELRVGKTVVSAVETGFDRALTTILDTNFTTMIAAGFLFMFGTGPTKGFAVTLGWGLLANLFSAVYVSRALFEFMLSRQPRAATLSI
ncbi:MAG: protein translocase subunit SecD [Candidatus Acidiferrales bacterium]